MGHYLHLGMRSPVCLFLPVRKNSSKDDCFLAGEDESVFYADVVHLAPAGLDEKHLGSVHQRGTLRRAEFVPDVVNVHGITIYLEQKVHWPVGGNMSLIFLFQIKLAAINDWRIWRVISVFKSFAVFRVWFKYSWHIFYNNYLFDIDVLVPSA